MSVSNLRLLPLCAALLALGWMPMVSPLRAAVSNLRIATDASPDFTDLPGLIHSATSLWPTDREKVWAMFYWVHQARRQTAPMDIHGMSLTDPIRQFNDYGYTMCSTVSGINQSIWEHMGLRHKYWDITLHTVSEVEYDGKFHLIDNSLSALYTTCDGKSLASVAEIGAEGGCEASGGKTERGHIGRYHCITGTSPNGFLIGSDTARSLQDEGLIVFNPNGLKFRPYFYDWDYGHRYILNLKPGEVYTRFYRKLGDERKYWQPNPHIGGKDPESVNKRYRIRGNGVWKFDADLQRSTWEKIAHSSRGMVADDQGGLRPAKAAEEAEVVFKFDTANVATSQRLTAAFHRASERDSASLHLSTNNGRQWKEIWRADRTGDVTADVELLDDVTGAYEILVKAAVRADRTADDVRLTKFSAETVTMLNSKTQPRLLLGHNEVQIGAGEQTGTVVCWPDLQADLWRPFSVDSKNIATKKKHEGYNAVMKLAEPGEGHVTFEVATPQDMTKLTYGARMYLRSPGSIEFFHSFDSGRTWSLSHSHTNSAMPWDVIQYVTIADIPPGTRTAHCKYVIRSRDASCGLYSVRMEAQHKLVDAAFQPLEATFTWKEAQPDRSLVERHHVQLIERLPFRYTINAGGADHPVMESLRINVKGAAGRQRYGYSDGKDAGGEKWLYRWEHLGKVLTAGKPYTVTVPSGVQWGAGDPDGNKLTDGVVGSSFAGGPAASFGLLWSEKQQPEITVDLGEPQSCGAFRIHLTGGYPWWDALKGEVRDRVEVLTSTHGQEFKSHGFFTLNLWRKDIPINHLLPDDETLTGHNFTLALTEPVKARHVRFRVFPARALVVTEVQALDKVAYTPFDLRVALPK